MDIVRNGELEATNYFFSIGDSENVLELTFNHDGRTYELGTGYGHIAIGVEDLDGALARLSSRASSPSARRTRSREGGSRICFVRDPDDYRIEIVEQRLAARRPVLPARPAPAAAGVDLARPCDGEALALELLDVAEPHRDAADVRLLLGQDERDAAAAAAGAAGAADAVDVARVVGRRIEVDHVRDVAEVEAAGGDVGRDERLHLALAEPGERAVAGVLRHVAVERDSGDVAPDELLGEAVGAALRADEDECEAALGLELLDQRVELPVGCDADELVLDLARARRGSAAPPRNETGCACTRARARPPRRRAWPRRASSGGRAAARATIRST